MIADYEILLRTYSNGYIKGDKYLFYIKGDKYLFFIKDDKYLFFIKADTANVLLKLNYL